jgi:hypothetical protein
VFGEFPPRSELTKYTRYPMIVPSSNPSYDTVYSEDYLRSHSVSEYFGKSTRDVLNEVKNDSVRGFCVVLIEYLQNVSKLNPKPGFGKSRTSLWGVQRPPLGSKTFIRCSSGVSWDDVAPIHILFYATNARYQVELSIDPQNTELIRFCEQHELSHSVETESDMTKRLESRTNVYNTVKVDGPMAFYPMAGQFLSLYFPLGHIKSTMPNDEEFALKARLSDKWLNTIF